MEKDKKVLLTGISGFLGAHTAIQLLEKGYKVIGTLRDAGRINAIQEVISSRTRNAANLSFEVADLLEAEKWLHLTKGVDFVQHIASPFPRSMPKREEALVVPAREGTLNILKAAHANGVKRVVITSSLAAIVYGKKKDQRQGPFNEADWTDTGSKQDITPYFRSKAIAEKAAWQFMDSHRGRTELSVICPGAILGPVLEEDYGTSANMVIKILDGSSPALPDIGFDIVDVRSVAALLIIAMEHPQAAGQRFIASSGFLTFKDIAEMLSKYFPERKVPTKKLPNGLVRIFSIFEPSLRPILLDLGIRRKVDRSRAKEVLGWSPADNQEAVRACAESVIRLGIIK